MGSSEKLNKSTTAIIASTSSPQSAAFQESPIFNYISNLSPIKPVKGTSAIQVLTALNSPLVFTSPQVHAHRHSIKLKSSQCQLSSRGEDDTAPSLKNSKDALPEMTDSMNPEGSMEIVDNEDDNVLAPPAVRNGSCLQSNICQNFVSNVTADQRVAQVGQNQLGKRRRLQFETAQENIVENDPPSSQTPSSTAAISEVLESSTSQNTRNSNVVNFSKKPSGIGLHLNSIVNAMPLSYPISGGKCPSFSSNSNLVEATREENAHQTPYTNAKTMKMIQYQENFHHSEAKEFDRPYPKKKRNKTDSSGDGCKRCNCKKTKCLKLYCDCFAAGIYCADSCSCQGCLNRPEYENTVLEKRQQIESRNPIAFAPKVVPRSTQPPRSQTEEDGDAVTAVTGRHKRGCNCKKSMCLKKYCECYQANVGCSDGCRCEGCQNIYGTKGVITEMGMESVNESFNDSFDDKKLKVGPIRLRSSLPHNLTPQTPSFQCSNHGNDASKACVFPGRYIPSPESECTFYPKSPNNSSSFDMMIEASNKNLEKVPFDELSYPNVEFMDEFSPGDWSRAQLLPPNGIRFSSLGFRGSSVITPVTLFGGSKPSFDIIDDDDTLKILKVASSSPNKKRVSPPRIGGVVGSSSLKSGRKFILKAVPSFPPLTPCIDSKQTSIPPPPDNITL